MVQSIPSTPLSSIVLQLAATEGPELRTDGVKLREAFCVRIKPKQTTSPPRFQLKQIQRTNGKQKGGPAAELRGNCGTEGIRGVQLARQLVEARAARGAGIKLS